MLLLFQTTSLISVHDLQLIAPELILTAIACLALVMEVILPYKLSKWTAYFSLAGIALAMTSLVAQFKSMGGSFSLNALRSEEHTSELQSLAYLVCRLLLEKKNKTTLPASLSTAIFPNAIGRPLGSST